MTTSTAHAGATPAQADRNTTLLPDAFTYQRVDVGELALNTAIGGSGSPVLLLHGYPQSHLMWRHVAGALAEHHTVVLVDLRGYGDSDKPTPGPGDSAYAKRVMARDQVELMHRLGYDHFQLVAHDRGARVAQRLVLDAPDVVSRLALLDIVPTRHVLANVNRSLATAYYHWFFLSTGHGIPEHLISGDPAFWVRALIEPLLGEGSSIEEPVMEEYIRAYSDRRTIDASCADYRAGASIDLVHDDETARRGQKIDAPLLALWGEQSYVGRGYDSLAVWGEYAKDVRGHALPAGHFVAEEQPDQVTALLKEWLE